MITIFLTVIHVIVCLVLILVILLQAGRGQGLAGPSFASGNVQSLLGTRAGDFLTKATTVSAICFLLTCFALDFLETQKSRSLLEVRRQSAAPIDMDAVKKALEKIKNEKTGAVPKTPATQAASEAAVTNPEAATALNTATAIPAAVPAPAAPASEPAK